MKNTIFIKNITSREPDLAQVISLALGNPSPDKNLEVIDSYKNPDHEILGFFLDNNLVGIAGFLKGNKVITIRL
jgi:hypothetical protein